MSIGVQQAQKGGTLVEFSPKERLLLIQRMEQICSGAEKTVRLPEDAVAAALTDTLEPFNEIVVTAAIENGFHVIDIIPSLSGQDTDSGMGATFGADGEYRHVALMEVSEPAEDVLKIEAQSALNMDMDRGSIIMRQKFDSFLALLDRSAAQGSSFVR